MSRRSESNLGSGVISTIILICGIGFSILTSVLVRQITAVAAREFSSDVSSSPPYWMSGFTFIVPGLVGILAAAINKKGGYISQMVFCTVGLVVLVISFFYDIRATPDRSFLDSQTCYVFDGVCSCSNVYQNNLQTLGFTCEEISTVIGLGVGADVTVLFGSILMLLSTAIAGKYTCVQEKQRKSDISRTKQRQVVLLARDQRK